MMDSAPMGRQLFVNVLEEERVLDEEESASESGLTTNEDGQPAFQWPEASAGTAELGVVLVCYNGWSDTIECLESLLRSDLPIRVAVVDNASTDGSAEKIRAWAEGALPYEAPDNALSQLSARKHMSGQLRLGRRRCCIIGRHDATVVGSKRHHVVESEIRTRALAPALLDYARHGA